MPERRKRSAWSAGLRALTGQRWHCELWGTLLKSSCLCSAVWLRREREGWKTSKLERRRLDSRLSACELGKRGEGSEVSPSAELLRILGATADWVGTHYSVFCRINPHDLPCLSLILTTSLLRRHYQSGLQSGMQSELLQNDGESGFTSRDGRAQCGLTAKSGNPTTWFGCCMNRLPLNRTMKVNGEHGANCGQQHAPQPRQLLILQYQPELMTPSSLSIENLQAFIDSIRCRQPPGSLSLCVCSAW